MTDLLPYLGAVPALLALLAPVLLALAAGVGWVVAGRRPKPRPVERPTVLEVAGDASAHRLEVARDEHAATVAEVESRADLSSAERLRAAEEAAALRRRR